MTDYSQLHLENIEIPENYLNIVKTGIWENEDHPVFRLAIQATADGICYMLNILPFADLSDEMRQIWKELIFMGYEEYPGSGVTGHCWAAFFDTDFGEESPELHAKLTFESETGLCCISLMDSLADYRELLTKVSSVVRVLTVI